MALTKKTTDRTGLGRMTVHMKNGNKSTESVDCSRTTAVRTYSDILAINGMHAELVRVLFNGKQIYPEISEMNTKDLCDYLKDHPHPGTIRNWVSKGKIPFHKMGGKGSATYFIVSEIDKWNNNGREI